ncbi:MAG: Na+/H+ antiporter NhaC family protein [Oscillospiraceae bacterium]|nr:Na+/H+ antiporter NhaC family protein [Oscillospiraceae bacterium]
MRRRIPKVLTAVLIAAAAASLFSLTAFAEGEGAYQSALYGTFWSLIPPVVAIVLALITKEVYSSLFIGILTGGLFYAGFAPVRALDTIVKDGLIAGVSNSGNAGIFLFLVLLGILVALINKAGGSAAFGRWAQRNIKSRVGAILATFVLGVLIFIDDYFNCLTVGSVMRPVTDGHKVSRAKLAYIIDATAAPVCMIAPISSWAAAVSGIVDEGMYSGVELFIRAIPYNFYSLLTFAFILALVLMKVDYGPMRRHELNAQLSGDLFSGDRIQKDGEEQAYSPKGRVWDLLLPIAALIVFCVIGMIYVGGFWDGSDFITAFANTDATVGLPWGALIALLLTFLYLLARRVITFKDAMGCIVKGFTAMVPALLILTFAITLKNMTGLLGADAFVAGMMEGAALGLQNFLPAVIFLVACFLAFSTGTSWGTFGILIPIVTAVFPDGGELMIIGVSACLAGAVCGDHCSPISDTTIMSSAGAQCGHMSHVSTQLPYALTVAGISFACFALAGFLQNWAICLLVGVALVAAVLLVVKMAQPKEGPSSQKA